MKLKLLLFIYFITANVFAQQVYFKHFIADDGLAHNTVVSLMQDKNGLIWIGTKGGLNSYDGGIFKSHINRKNHFGTIGNNFISSLCEDKNGIIWVGTGRGVIKYDPLYEDFKEIPLGKTMGATNLKVDANNNIWWLKNTMLVRLDQTKNRITTFPNVQASAFDFDRNGNIWLGDEFGKIYQFEPKSLKITKLVDLFQKKLAANKKLITKIFVHGGKVMVGTEKCGLLSYDIKTLQIKSYRLTKDKTTDIYVRDIIYGGDDNFWIATESGIFIYDFARDKVTNLRKKADNKYTLSDNAIYCLLKDNQGGYWAGSYFGGLNYQSPDNSKFQKYISLQSENSISGNEVREISSNDGENIWIGTEDAGISKLNITTGKFTRFPFTGDKYGVSYPNVHGLFATKDKLYIGYFLHGLDIMDLKTEKVAEKYPIILDSSGFGSDFIMSIYETSQNRVFIGTVKGGLFEFFPKTKTLKRVKFMHKDAFIYAIKEDHAGVIWVGTLQNGTYSFDPKTNEKHNLRFNEETSDIEYQVQGIFEDSANNLWFTTEGGGLIKVGPDRKIKKKYTIENGLPSNNLFRTLEDKQGQLWISSLKGLICLNPKNDQIKIFTRSNGLLTDQFNYNSAYKDRKGRMYFGTVQGMISFNPEEISRPTPAPAIFITGLQVNNKDEQPGGTILKKTIAYLDTLILKYDEANFSLEFAALNYGSAKTILYKYLMKGLENDNWTSLKTNQKAYFTDLSPGTYHFLLTAESTIGSWKTPVKELTIIIKPPFWKSKVAYLVYLMAICGLFYLSASLYKKDLERKNIRKLQLFEFEKNKEIYQAKIEFFTNIAHEIQTPLTLIKGPVEMLINKIDEFPNAKKNLEVINKNTNKLISLSGKLLDFRKTEIDQFGLNFVKIDIKNAIKQELLLFNLETEQKGLNVELKLPREKIEAFVDREAFLKIINNLLSNAVKYAISYIKIKVEPINKSERFVIHFMNDSDAMSDEQMAKIFEPFYRLKKNTGQPGTGIGLPIARSLAELHGGSLSIIKSAENLVIFELALPIHHTIEFDLSNWKKL